MKFLIIQFSPTTCYFFPLLSKYSPQHPVPNTLSLCSSLNVTGHVSLPYKTTDKTVFLYILILAFYRHQAER
jgi:hypothetical protein